MRFASAFVFAGLFFDLALGFVIEDFAEPEQWPRDVGVPGVATSSGSSDSCKKDLLILLDTSWSIGTSAFNSKMKPFLESLVKNSKLNVAPDGTHIALVTFADDANTKLRFNFETYNTAEALVDYINNENNKGLDYNKVSGGRTFTGKAAEIADTQVFPKRSPQNARPKIADVIMLLTDGEPRGIRRGDQLNLALKHTSSMKDKDILIVGIAVGPGRKDFKHQIVKMSTNSSMVFDAEFDGLDTIIDKVVDASCTPFQPGDCGCPEIFAPVMYLKPSETTVRVRWPIPTLKCRSNRDPNLKPIVKPNYQSPHDFAVGKHDIQYTYTFKGYDVICHVKIVVKPCTCPSRPPVVAYVSGDTAATIVQWSEPAPSCSATLKSLQPNKPSRSAFTVGNHRVNYVYSTAGGFDLTCAVDIDVRMCLCHSGKTFVVMNPDKTQVSVNWVEPKPNCPGQKIVKATTQPANIEPRASFGVGEHVVRYDYEMSSGQKLQCSMEITVEVVPCQGVDYDPATEMCCCGNLQEKKQGHKCCGQTSYDPTEKRCCPLNDNLVGLKESCPVPIVGSVG